MARKLTRTIAYLALAYFLMLSYQIFTQTALSTIITALGTTNPLLATTLSSSMGLAVFIFSFAWTFVLSTIISRLIFGKEKRVSIQFLISLGLTIASTAIINQLNSNGLDLTNPNQIIPSICTQAVSNTAFAIFYLALPFIFMAAIDLHITKKIPH
ncbi:MAG: hypothetical protein ACFCUE_13045 [Candidatus Bathyarchaeia archaeon]